MNKSKIVLAATGGVIGIAVLVMAFLVWRAYAAKVAAAEGDEENEGLETVVENANRLSRKPVYPCAASVEAIASNRASAAAWKDEAFKLASRGDRPVKPMTAAQFKTDMVTEAKRLVGLPGGVQGKIAKPDFPFGPFREYIAEGKMPSESRIPELQRQWDDLTLIVETLSGCGVSELVDVQLKAKVEEKPDEVAAKGKRRPVRNRKAEEEATASAPSEQGYVITFTTRPLGFVKCINAFETCERFCVVEDFSFLRENDVIATALGGGDKKEAAAQQSGGRRRRRGQAEVQKAEDGEKPKNGIITDPLLDAPFKVTLTVSTYDFKTLQDAPKENEEDKK